MQINEYTLDAYAEGIMQEWLSSPVAFEDALAETLGHFECYPGAPGHGEFENWKEQALALVQAVDKEHMLEASERFVAATKRMLYAYAQHEALRMAQDDAEGEVEWT